MISRGGYRQHVGIGYKQAKAIVANHYQVDTNNARKLCLLFPHDDVDKGQAVVQEALRIIALHDSLDCELNRCRLCGKAGRSQHVRPRDDLTLIIPVRQKQFSDWIPWHICAPTLCRRCWHKSIPTIYAYQQLITLTRLCGKLKRARYVH